MTADDAQTDGSPREHTFLSGIQPSGLLHLGNYFGAIRQHVAATAEPGEHFYFIADYHALTTSRDPEALRNQVRETAITYLALGLDPARATLFRQSDVPEVTELSWLLSTVTGMGLLERAHSYKDKLAKGIRPSVGLYALPQQWEKDGSKTMEDKCRERVKEVLDQNTDMALPDNVEKEIETGNFA